MTHKAIMLAETAIIPDGLTAFLEYFEVPDWKTDTNSSGEALIEIMGRLCYKSFDEKLNVNLTRTRQGNRNYLDNLLKQRHGSVLEHSTVTFTLLNVSRILTHELVRHRVGIAFSQESQRFVRLDSFNVYIPDLTIPLRTLTPEGMDRDTWVSAAQDDFFLAMEDVKRAAIGKIEKLVKMWGIDAKGVPFHVKKQLTSAMRRFIPGGVCTHIGVTANHNMWRHVIDMRTSPGAEIEIVQVLDDVALQLEAKYPNIYQDMMSAPHENGIHYYFPR